MKSSGNMGKSNRSATKSGSNIQCIEVLISRSYITGNSSSNLLWTLSVYSLENQPVKKNRTALLESEIFHFMVYDWNRTIKALLEDRQIPYSITHFFNRDSIYPDGNSEDVFPTGSERALIAALDKLPDSGGVTNALTEGLPPAEEESADLVH